VIYTRAGEVLLLRRRTPAGYWQSVTGSLGWCERAAAAARRELFEETGLRPARGALQDVGWSSCFPIVPPWRSRYAPTTRYNCEHVYALELVRRRPVRLHAREHRAWCWLPWPQAAGKVASWTNREAIVQVVGRR